MSDLAAGLVGALFSPGFNVTTNDTFHLLPPGVKPLTVKFIHAPCDEREALTIGPVMTK